MTPVKAEYQALLEKLQDDTLTDEEFEAARLQVIDLVQS